ncbi:MAG: YkgJ family cysteine cluster protein [Phycisphaerales bacterium]
MTDENLSVLGQQPETLENIQGEVISFSFEAAEKKIPFSINIMTEKATLSDIVIPARKLSSKVAVAHREMATNHGKVIPCKKGCCSCCGSLIPISVPEAFRMSEEFAEMPIEKNNRLLSDCVETAKMILEKERRDEFLKNLGDKNKVAEISKWYSELGTTCPFLSKRGLCKIYEQRPLACREHIVVGTPKMCANENECKPNVVPMQVSVLEALGELAGEFEGTEVEAVMLPFSVAWANDNPKRGRRKWPAAKIAKRFADIIQKKAKVQRTAYSV